MTAASRKPVPKHPRLSSSAGAAAPVADSRRGGTYPVARRGLRVLASLLTSGAGIERCSEGERPTAAMREGIQANPAPAFLPLFCGVLQLLAVRDAPLPKDSRPAGDRRRGSRPVTAHHMSAAPINLFGMVDVLALRHSPACRAALFTSSADAGSDPDAPGTPTGGPAGVAALLSAANRRAPVAPW